MKDMFYNYDHNINYKEYPEPICYDDPKKILIDNKAVKMIYDVKGNQIGVEARYKDDFNLYFNLDGCVEGSSIDELVANSTINFQIIDFFHQVVIDKVIDSSCYDDGVITVYINPSEADNLRQDSYRMKLTLNWPGGSYELFAEADAILMIR